MALTSQIGSQRVQALQTIITQIDADTMAFYGAGNQTAGTRVRIKMQDLKTLAQTIRAEIAEEKKARKLALQTQTV
jgi:hypothetical protein